MMWLTLIYLQYLGTADFAIREELSLKAAILAEKFAPDFSWYGVSIMLQDKILEHDIVEYKMLC